MTCRFIAKAGIFFLCLLGSWFILLASFEKEPYFSVEILPRDDCNFKPTKIEHKTCPLNGIVTVIAGGRLGNKIWEYATVWGISLKTGLKPFIPACVQDELNQIFENISIPTLEQIQLCKIRIDSFVNSSKTWRFPNQSILLQRYFADVQPILQLPGEFQRLFKFKAHLNEASQRILRTASKRIKNPVFIGTHARRNDYLFYLMDSYKVVPVEATFFKLAMALMGAKYRNAIFIMVSDSMEWLQYFHYPQKQIFKHYSVDPGLGLAVLTACNHTIFDYGMFGATAAILAGGDTYFYDFNQSFARRISSYFKNWKGISY